MELRDITEADYPLWVAMQCDPEMMGHLGGPQPLEKMPGIFQNNLRTVAEDKGWVFKIVHGEPEQDAGSVVIWESGHDGDHFNEMGWMVLPQFQGQGLATQAVQATLDRARATGRWDIIHAYPVASNAASNAVCRKTGFTQLEERDFEYSGRTLRCNHWRIDLRE